MKILHIITGINIGGAELALKRLIESFAVLPDYTHIVISLTNAGKIGEDLRASGIEVTGLGIRSFLDVPRAFARLLRLIRQTSPDIVQTWMYHADLLGGIAARLAGNSNLVWGVRTTSPDMPFTTLMIRAICAKLSYILPHTIVCVAPAALEAHADCGYDTTRMIIIPNGFDLTKLTATKKQRQKFREQNGISEQHIVIGSLGRFDTNKDHKNFIMAAKLLAPLHPQLRFMMVGRDVDANNTVLYSFIAATGYAERFILLGERLDVFDCYAAMDIFCLHSRIEGLPNVLGEAMAMGLPCISTDVSGAALLLGDTEFIVPIEDSPQLAQGISRLLEMSPDTRRSLGDRAKQRINNQFSMSNMRHDFEKLYNNYQR